LWCKRAYVVGCCRDIKTGPNEMKKELVKTLAGVEQKEEI